MQAQTASHGVYWAYAYHLTPSRMKKHLLRLSLIGLLFGAFIPTLHAQDADLDAQLEDIQAYVRISDHLSTSGQIAYDQIELLKQAGFEVVVNLAPADEARNGLEGYLVAEQGMTYLQIPVSWREPSQRDLQLFFDVLTQNQDRKVFVHCFANMRVSAFVYLYRTLHQGISEDQARADLEKIWKPENQDQWAAFIETARAEKEAGR